MEEETEGLVCLGFKGAQVVRVGEDAPTPKYKVRLGLGGK